MAAVEISIASFLNKINQFILNPIIALAFVLALLVFFWGVFQFVRSETADTKREEGRKKIIYGLFGMFIMFSAYGLIRLVLNTVGINSPTNYPGF